MAKNAADIVSAWAGAMGSPQTQARYKAGIMALQVAPTALAATPEAEQRYQDGVARAVSSGRRARALQAVSLQAYQQAATTKGAARLASGAQASQAKFAAFVAEYQPVWQQMTNAVKNMPKGGLVNAANRVQAALQVLMQHAGTA